MFQNCKKVMAILERGGIKIEGHVYNEEGTLQGPFFQSALKILFSCGAAFFAKKYGRT